MFPISSREREALGILRALLHSEEAAFWVCGGCSLISLFERDPTPATCPHCGGDAALEKLGPR